MSMGIYYTLTKKEVQNGSEQSANNQVLPVFPCLGSPERGPGAYLPEMQKSVLRCEKKNQEGVT